MCMRRVCIDSVDMEIPKKSAQSLAEPMISEGGEKPQPSQSTYNSRSLPPLLENCLGFIKGTFGYTPGRS